MKDICSHCGAPLGQKIATFQGWLVVEGSNTVEGPFGEKLKVGRRGVQLLYALILRKGKVVTYDALILYIWQGDEPGDARQVLSVTLSHLRKNMRGVPWKIETVWGVGLRLVGESDGSG